MADRVITCKCGQQFIWVKSDAGRPTPVNVKKAPVWIKVEGEWRQRTAHLSHFITCPHREEFSKGRKKNDDDYPTDPDPRLDPKSG